LNLKIAKEFAQLTEASLLEVKKNSFDINKLGIKMSQHIEPIQIEISLNVMFPSVNCYLVPGEQLTLIDCGLDGEENWIALQEKIKSHGFQVEAIEQVIVTHEHRDHIGLLAQVMEASNPTVKIPRQIEKWFSDPLAVRDEYLAFNKMLYPKLGFPAELLVQSYEFVQTMRTYHQFDTSKKFEFFDEGDILHFGNTEWEALNTPGHCPHQFVFVQKEQKRIVSSDMLLPIAPMPIITEDPQKPKQPTRALHDLLISFDRLRKLDLQKIYPGHGPIFENANQLIDKQLARIEMRKKECLEAIQSGLQTPYEISRKMYPYQNLPPDFSGLYMVLGYIDLLKEESKIKNIGGEKELRYVFEE